MRTINPQLPEDLIRVILAWDALERSLGAPPIIDFCLIEKDLGAAMAKSRYAIFQELISLKKDIPCSLLRVRIESYLTYLRALLGQEIEFVRYIEKTLGYTPMLFDESYLDSAKHELTLALSKLGIALDGDLYRNLDSLDQEIKRLDLEDVFRQNLATERAKLMTIIDLELDFKLNIEFCNIDEYWDYWVDGDLKSFRLRINSRHKVYTQSEAILFVYHELLAHCGQCYSFAQGIKRGKLPGPWGLTFIGGPEQFCFEGLAQTLPLWVGKSDLSPVMMARILTMRYKLLVQNNIHYSLNRGATIEESLAYYRKYLPIVTEDKAVHDLRDRTRSPLLRSYQFVYSQSFETFYQLHLKLDATAAREFINKCYQEPVMAREIISLAR